MKSTRGFHNRSCDTAAAVLGDVVGGRVALVVYPRVGTATPQRGRQSRAPQSRCSTRNGQSHPTGRVGLFHGSRGQRDAKQTRTNAVIRYAGLAVAAARPQLQPAAASDSVPCPEVGSRRDSRYGAGSRHHQRRCRRTSAWTKRRRFWPRPLSPARRHGPYCPTSRGVWQGARRPRH
jgi:hypothetical protein